MIYRIDKIMIEFVNCPLGIRTLERCRKCFWYENEEKIGILSDGVKCEVNKDD